MKNKKVIIGIIIGVVILLAAVAIYLGTSKKNEIKPDETTINKVPPKEVTAPKEEDKTPVTPPKEEQPIKDKIVISLFWGNGCPHCERLKEFFKEIEDEYGKYYTLKTYEVWYNEDNNKLLDKVAAYVGKNVTGVPFYIIGETPLSGYGSSKKEQIKKTIKEEYEKDTRINPIEELAKES